MRMNLASAVPAALCLLLAACAGITPMQTAPLAAQPDPAAAPGTHVQPSAPPAKDRAAILAMAGEFRVSFAFQETVVLAEGYERRDSKESGAWEAVLVVADEPGRIVLQHLLVSRDGGHVTKHWRQDWTWQAPARFEFGGEQSWQVRALAPATTTGAWTQCVYEVDDAPRYCGTGRWQHQDGVATWTSDRGWRPLPRREYSVRDDYNALSVENRHTIVPGGWTHEQDNTKMLRAADGTSQPLVREFGFNDYIRLEPGQFDFAPAYDYWRDTAGYWARVRARWDERLGHGRIRLAMPVDGMPLIMATFEQAERAAAGERVPDREIDALFDRYVKWSAAYDKATATAPQR
jgi:hypothetical protein